MLLRCLEIASKHGYIVSKQLLSTFVPLPRPLLLHKMPNSWRRPAEPTMYMKLNHHPYCTRLSFIKKPSCAPLSHIGIVVRLHHALILLYYNYKPCMAMMSQQQTHVNVVPSSTSLLQYNYCPTAPLLFLYSWRRPTESTTCLVLDYHSCCTL